MFVQNMLDPQRDGIVLPNGETLMPEIVNCKRPFSSPLNESKVLLWVGEGVAAIELMIYLYIKNILLYQFFCVIYLFFNYFYNIR